MSKKAATATRDEKEAQVHQIRNDKKSCENCENYKKRRGKRRHRRSYSVQTAGYVVVTAQR